MRNDQDVTPKIECSADLLRNTHFLISDREARTRFKRLNSGLDAVSLLLTFYSNIINARTSRQKYYPKTIVATFWSSPLRPDIRCATG